MQEIEDLVGTTFSAKLQASASKKSKKHAQL
jgi:hypothetical protein